MSFSPYTANWKRNAVQFSAIFMIILVITLPITLAKAFAGFSAIPILAPQQQEAGSSSAVNHDGETVQRKSEHTELFAIKSLEAYGSDKIVGIRRKTDQTTINARVEPDANQIEAKQLWLGTISQFTSCEGTPESDYLCTITYPSSPNTLDSRGYSFDVNYYSDDYLSLVDIPQVDRAMDRKAAKILIDDRPPYITSFSASPETVGIGDITFTYIITDNSCASSACTGYCSGIKDIKVYKDSVNESTNSSSLIDTESINSSSCVYSGSFTKSSSEFSEGQNTIYAVASDMFDQQSPQDSVVITVNSAGPQIINDSFALLDSSGEDIGYLTPNSQDISMQVVIMDNDLDPAGVIADFNSINGQGNKSAVCTKEGNYYYCTWPSFRLSINQSGTVSAEIYAKDLLGNSISSMVSKQVLYDGTGPVVSSITTDTDPFLVSGANLTVTLQEDGAGLSKGNIYLDLTPLGLSIVKADSCNEGWTCKFTNLDPSVSGKRYIALAPNSMDDVGNLVTGSVTKLVNVDKTPPSIITFDTTYVAGANPLVDGMPTAGASIEISATVEEDGTLSAVADFSNLIEGASSIEGSCSSGNTSMWTCTWSSPPIDRSGPYTADIIMTLSDSLGNKVIVRSPVKVIGISNDPNPNFWSSAVSCSPSLVDREVTPYIDMKIYCVVHLSSNNAKILAMQMSSCYDASSGVQQAASVVSGTAASTAASTTGTQSNLATLQEHRTTPAVGSAIAMPTGLATTNPDEYQATDNPAGRPPANQAGTYDYGTGTTGTGTTGTNDYLGAEAALGLSSTGSISSYVASASLVNDINSSDPIIEIILSRQQMNINSLNLVCPFQIVSRVGDVVTSVPETENAKLNIYFYNNPNGNFGDNIDDKIDDAKKKAEGFWNIIGWLHKIFFWAEKICNILYTISRVILVFKGFQSSTNTAAIAAMGTPAFPGIEAVRVPGCSADQALGNTHTYLFTFGDKFCAFINCQMTGGKDQKTTPITDNPTGTAATAASTTPAEAAKPEQSKGWWSKTTSGTGKTFKSIGSGMSNWNQWGYDTLGKMDFGGVIKKNTGKDPSSYMNAKDNLVVAILTGCIPGIIAGVEKLRQIECMYGYCLQEGVKGDGVPITSCDDQKDYAYCKYIFGEIFALIPFTAFFDHFFGTIKNALSDPLSALSIPFAYICKPVCIPGPKGSVDWAAGMAYCGWLQLGSMIGEIISQVQNIINADAWKIQNDYCKMLTDSEDTGTSTTGTSS